MKRVHETPPLREEEDAGEWEKEEKTPRPYKFGETVDLDDTTRNASLCPTCGGRKKGNPKYGLGEAHYICSQNSRHRWMMKKGVIEDEDENLNRKLEFPRA